MERLGLLLGFSLFILSTALPVEEKQGVDQPIRSGNGCVCEQYTCKCCEYVGMKLNGNACISFSYLSNDIGISVALTWNNYTLYNETISARNPPAMCFAVPELEKVAEFCLRLYDLRFEKNFHGCFEVKVILYHIIHRTVNIGCVDIPTKTVLPSFYTYKHEDYNLNATDLHSVVLI